MSADQETIDWPGGQVSAVWHRPVRGVTYLVLAHGAGGNMHTPGLADLAEILCRREIGVVRFNFPYAEARRKVPDPQPVLEACYQTVAERVRTQTARLFLGGRSMGGRIASHIVAKGAAADGLVFLSYPLHPPGQPERLRTRHLPKISAPMLFVQGSRDGFARPDLLNETISKLPKATLRIIEGADHSLKVKDRSAKDVTEEIAGAVWKWISAVS